MSKYLVVDANLSLRLVTPNPNRPYYRQLWREWSYDGFNLCAPALWVYEVTSALTKMAYFKVIKANETKLALNQLQRLDIQLFAPNKRMMTQAFNWTKRLNRAAAYDSFYLALAESLACELWTADQKLVHTVNEDWVKLAA